MDGGNLSIQILETLRAKGFPPLGLRECQGDFGPFCAALAAAVDHNYYGPYVDTHTPAELRAAGARAFLSKDKKAGIAVWPDGNIRAAFSDRRSIYHPASGELLLTALAAGGDRLDCFDGFLSVLYPMFGFIPVARVKFDPKFAPENWQDEFGTPDIVFFKHCGHSPEKTAGLIGSYPDYPDLSQLPCLNSYEEAREYRDNDMASGR